MKYRTLPVLKQIEDIATKEGAEAALAFRTSLATELFRCGGFAFLVHALRVIEARGMAALTEGKGNTDRILGQLQCVEGLRKTLGALLPDAEAAAVDWFDDSEEDFLVFEDKDRVNAQEIA